MSWFRRRELTVPEGAERAVCTTCGGGAFRDVELGNVWVHVRPRDHWHLVHLPLGPEPPCP